MRRRRLIALTALPLTIATACGGDDVASDQVSAVTDPAGDDGAQRAVLEERVVESYDAAVSSGAATGGTVAPTGPLPPIEPLPPEPDTDPPRTTNTEDPGVAPFVTAADDPLSTFATDVDTASYTQTRSWISTGQRPPTSLVRPEEFVNYFRYDYPAPADGDTWAIHVDGAPAPWNPAHPLIRVGLNTAEIAREDRPPATLTFVVDTSGSMEGAPLQTVKDTLTLLVDQLRPDDRIGIVTYGDIANLVTRPVPLSEADTISPAIAGLTTNGSTYAEAGLQLGYEVAREAMAPGLNAVVLASDGVANVGATGPDAILDTVRDGVDAGLTLLTLGVGQGEYNDFLMEQLANDGNGTAFYIDSREEAERLFVDRLESTLVHVARDAKVQVEFDPAAVREYRLIGYDNRAVADDDFRNDEVDAGEVGAGHQVTAMYELVLAEGASAEAAVATVRLRWEDARTREVSEIERTATVTDIATLGPGYATAATAVTLAEVLRGSSHLGAFELQAMLDALPEGVDAGLVRLAADANDAVPPPGS
ncbi:MAG: von Willebrand factor type A domain-containing protein [Actinobacteria bacterium]|nr:von Willebrand factor type A domain-containing protein [Actinomycetota bacterium]